MFSFAQKWTTRSTYRPSESGVGRTSEFRCKKRGDCFGVGSVGTDELGLRFAQRQTPDKLPWERGSLKA